MPCHYPLWDTCENLYLDLDDIKVFRDSLVGISYEHVQVKGHITLETMLILNENAMIVNVIYLIVDTSLPNNIIMGSPSLNLLGAILSTLHLSMKYPLLNKRVRLV